MELEIENTEVIGSNNIQIEIPKAVEISEGKKDYEVRVVKKEYTIIGDSIFIPSTYEDAPPWLKEFIDTTIEVAVINRDQSLIDRMEAILTAMDYVPKNQYTEQINQIVGEDGIINSRIATLNSNLTDAINSTNATVAEINLTYASKNEAAAIATNVITASLSGSGEIGSTLIQLQEAYANLESTTAQNISMLESVMEGEINGNAAAMETIRTYVGIDESGESTGVGLLADVKILQKQNDGVIETVTGTYDVMLGIEDPNNNTDNDQLDVTKEPYASWLAEDLANGNIAKRSAHVGDVYIKYSNSDSGYKSYERAYKFIRTVVDTISPYATDSEGFTWSLIVDTDAQNAYVAALNAYDLADDKRRIFVGLGSTSAPSVPYDQGDLWLIDVARVVNGYSCKVGDILRCIETKSKIGSYEQNDWIIASSYANAIAAQAQSVQDWIDGAYSTTIADINTQLDQKAESYYQDTMPHPEGVNASYSVWVGDLWKKPSTNDEYVYQLVGGTYVWVKTDVPDSVYDTIDGKKSIFTGNTVPTAIGINDMWITGDSPTSPYLPKSIYIWDGTVWMIPVRYTDDQYAKDIENGTRQIDLSEHINRLGWTDDSTIDNFLTVTYAVDKLNIQEQIDGKADTYYQGEEPYSFSSLSEAEKLARDGDVWYDTTPTSGVEAYRFSATSGWVKIEDAQTLQALSDAANAQATADGKIQNFTSRPFTPYYIGDTWMQGATGDIYVCQTERLTGSFSQSDWVIASKYTDDTQVIALQTGLANGTVTIDLTNAYVGSTPLATYLSNEIDGKVGIYSGETAPINGQPSGVAVNDIYLWFTTASKVLANGTTQVYDITRTYKYSGSVWNEITTDSNISALADLADGKRTVFSGATIPVGAVERDIWIPSASNASYTKGEVYQYIGSAWVVATKYTEDLDAFVNNTYTPAVTSLQDQVDGKVESWFQNSTSDPKIAWTDATTRSNHDGDLWYQLDTKRSYWYSSSTHSWNLIDDEKAIQALANAAAAQTAANNAQTSANTANSLLADIANDNKLVPSEKVAVKKEWDIIQSEYTKNLAQGNVYGISTSNYTSAYNSLSGYITPLLSSLTTTSDIVGITFRGMFKAYYDANVDLLNSVANKINAIADGKITSYYVDTFASLQTLSNGWTTAEKASNVGDLATVWNDSTLDNNGLWRWNGTSWVSARDKKLVALASTVTNLSTELSHGTGTWASADSALENSLKTEISSEGARVEGKFEYGSTVSINGINQSAGFGIVNELSSVTGAPAAGNSEFWINAQKFKFTNNANSGTVSPFTIDASGPSPKVSFNGSVSFENVTKSPIGSGSTVFKEDWYSSTTKVVTKPTGWSSYSDSGAITITPEGLSISSYSGNDMVTLVFDRSIPINTNKRYKLTVSVKRTNGMVTAKLGIAGRNNIDTVWVNTAGSNSILTSQHYMINNLTPTASMSSYSSNYWSTNNLVLGSDYSINPNVAYFRPMIVVNYNGFPGTIIISGIKIEEVEASVNAFIASNNDVFAQSQGFTSYADMVSKYSSMGKTIIDSGYINTGLVTTNSIEVGTGLINGFIQSNDFTELGGSGFRLKSNAAGTYEDPSIYGAFIRAGSLDITSLSLTQPGVSPVYPVSKLKFSDFFTADVKYSVRSDFTPTMKIIEFQSYVYPINYPFTSEPSKAYKYVRTDGESTINYSYFIHSVFESAFDAEDGSITKMMFPIARFSVKPKLLEFYTDFAERATNIPHASIDCTSVAYPNSASATLASGHRVTFMKVETYWYLLLHVTHYVPSGIVKPINWMCQVQDDLINETYSGTIKTTGPINGSIHNF